MSKQEKIVSLVDTWRTIILGEQKSWVMFEHGTCVILMKPQEDLQAQAREILAEWGPVVPGSSLGDFTVITLKNYPGWVVEYHHPDILNYVSPNEFEEDEPDHVSVGYIGRNKRREDAKSLNIVHIEDKRSQE
ncbi:MAG: hypothetical protein ACFFCZ_09950 [Promethearchaeota archaeon]